VNLTKNPCVQWRNMLIAHGLQSPEFRTCAFAHTIASASQLATEAQWYKS